MSDSQWPGHYPQQIGRIRGFNYWREQVGADLVEVSRRVLHHCESLWPAALPLHRSRHVHRRKSHCAPQSGRQPSVRFLYVLYHLLSNESLKLIARQSSPIRLARRPSNLVEISYMSFEQLLTMLNEL